MMRERSVGKGSGKMLYTLENEVLCVQVRSLGAELRSIRERADETEYLWNGDPVWWKYSSPVLFPIVGKLRGGKYRVNGRDYQLPGHGLGRISEFRLVHRQPDSVEFALDWSEESLKSYPWKFQLLIGYALEKNRITVRWVVRNLDDKEMIYSIGAHGAYRCPIVAGESFEDCYLQFSEQEDAGKMPLNENGQFLRGYGTARLSGAELPLRYEMFRHDALAYDAQKSDTVRLCSRKSDKCLTITAKGFPYWGYWTPGQGGAPFLCIEPWHGHADYADFDGEFAERAGSERLQPGGQAEYSYTITIGR